MPDGIRASTVKYDATLLRRANEASRFVDRYCRRRFYPELATRYFDGNGAEKLRIDDLLSLTSLQISEDNGASYATLTVDVDFRLTWWGDANDPRSYTRLDIDPRGSKGAWPEGPRSVKVVGIWGYADDRNLAWEDSLIDLATTYSSGGTQIQIADVTVKDVWGLEAAIHVGRLLRIQSEYFEVTGITDNTGPPDFAAVLGARNGTVAAGHTSPQDIFLWRPPDPIKEIVTIMGIRSMERGFQGFGDARANPDVGQMFWMKALDPEALAKLNYYRRVNVG